VAHDFNNLMASVLGHATLTREQLPPDSPLHDTLRPIEDAAHHAASLCQQMLTFAGKGSSHRGPLDLQALVSETHRLLRMGVPRCVDLRIGTAHDLPAVEADAGQLKQVLLNLVWNATEAIGDVPGMIEIRTGSSVGRCAEQGPGHFCGSLAPVGHVWFEVGDTGTGIPPESVARIFEPFYTTREVGRGLGLSAVAGIVRGHGGCVCVASEPGRTLFRVSLPARQCESATATTSDAATPCIPAPGARLVDAALGSTGHC
jgi:signal transduction histidine kinase